MMVNSASRTALAQMRSRLGEVLPEVSGTAGQRELAEQLYSVSALLDAQPRLRRTLGDPATDASGRSELARQLFGGRLSGSAVNLVSYAAERRWSSPWDLADSLELMADDALLAAAEQAGELDTVEDELFRFERILDGSGELIAALDERVVPAERRQALLKSVLAGKVNPITEELLTHAVGSTRKASLLLAIDDLLEASAARRERSVARVVTATELTEQQSRRLGEALSTMYGRPISVRSAVDPRVQGGLQVKVGDEVIDGTVTSRLAAARAALAG
ncbi:MAG TPA: F0F1 ATP synthase subunit delta [Jatrophihabitans sp.]|nr:F0F1 ATP synthase subunit delta [Jatrophihabitans sp.]